MGRGRCAYARCWLPCQKRKSGVRNEGKGFEKVTCTVSEHVVGFVTAIWSRYGGKVEHNGDKIGEMKKKKELGESRMFSKRVS